MTVNDYLGQIYLKGHLIKAILMIHAWLYNRNKNYRFDIWFFRDGIVVKISTITRFYDF